MIREVSAKTTTVRAHTSRGIKGRPKILHIVRVCMEFLKPKNGREEEGTPVSNKVVELCWEQSRTNATISSCTSFISSKILGHGIVFASLDGKQMNVEFERHVSQFFVPFAKKALECILVQGYCVYGINPRFEKTLFPVPFVYSRKMFDVNMVVKHGEDLVQVKSKDGKSKMTIFTEDMPDQNGMVKSRVARISKIASYMEELEKHDIHAFAIRSRPPILTKTTTDSTFDSRDVITGSVPGLRAQDENDNMEMRNKITMKQFRQQHDLISTLNRERIDSSDQFWEQHVDPRHNTFLSESLRNDVEGFVPRFIPLPNDADVARFDAPTERKDLVQLERFCKSQICLGMGIPETHVDGRNSMSNAKFGEEFLRVSLMPLRSALSTLLLAVYEQAFGQSDMQCSFPGTQSVENMLEWYKLGLISREAIVRAISVSENLNQADFEREAPPLKKSRTASEHMPPPNHYERL